MTILGTVNEVGNRVKTGNVGGVSRDVPGVAGIG